MQVLTGYVAIGGAHYAIFEKATRQSVLSWWCAVLGVLLFAVYVFLASCIQQRLRLTRKHRNMYVAKMHAFFPETLDPDEDKEQSRGSSTITPSSRNLSSTGWAVLTLLGFIFFGR